jgi:hypothetical protein
MRLPATKTLHQWKDRTKAEAVHLHVVSPPQWQCLCASGTCAGLLVLGRVVSAGYVSWDALQNHAIHSSVPQSRCHCAACLSAAVLDRDAVEVAAMSRLMLRRTDRSR